MFSLCTTFHCYNILNIQCLHIHIINIMILIVNGHLNTFDNLRACIMDFSKNILKVRD